MTTNTVALGEFELIGRYFSNIGSASNAIDLAVGDDCALLTPPAGQQLATSVDTLVADVHFPAQADAYLVAQKALRCNLSDLAAMGAEPLAFTLALSLPASDEAWLAAFSNGLRDCANEFGIALIGGDTTHSKIAAITIQVMGTMPTGSALLRSGAQIGDAIYVSGTLGDARAALDFIGSHVANPAVPMHNDQQFFLDRYFKPSPRIQLGVALRHLASAAIDISDGFAADLGHILERSSSFSQTSAGAEIELTKIPFSNALAQYPHALDYALSGGDDYELCFTVPQPNRALAEHAARTLSIPITHVGTIVAGNKIFARDGFGVLHPVELRGYTHF